MNKPNIRVIDFQKAKDEMDLTRIFDKYDVTVDDWMEKDYGVIIYAICPENNLEVFKRVLSNSNFWTYDENL